MFKVFTRLSTMVRNLRAIVSDGLSFFASVWRRRTALAAENLFLRKQLALFREREKKAMPTTPADRFVFSKLARWFDWRGALLIVKPGGRLALDQREPDLCRCLPSFDKQRHHTRIACGMRLNGTIADFR